MIIRTKKDMTIQTLADCLGIAQELIMDSNPVMDADAYHLKAGDLLQVPLFQHSKQVSEYVEVMNNPGSEMHDSLQHDTILNTKKPYDSNSFYQDLEVLLKAYPFVKKEIIGYSVQGKPIIELKFGQGRKHIHMNGSFHANEWITTNIMMHWLQEFLEALVNQNQVLNHNCLTLYQNTAISFVPMVNPDGVDLVRNGLPSDKAYRSLLLEMNNNSDNFSEWKANIRGIDLNNQYPANWDIEKERKIPKSPAPRDYPGDAPLTEPEAIALAELVRKHQFDRVLAFHTQGEEIYWGYMKREPDEAEDIVNEFERLSGYKAVRDIDSHAGFRDWYVNEWRKPGYTVELGLGVNPLPFSQFDEIYKKSKGIFFAALYM